MRDALKGLALRFSLGPAASLLPLIVWVAALIGAACAALSAAQAVLRLLVVVSFAGGLALVAVAVIGVLAD